MGSCEVSNTQAHVKFPGMWMFLDSSSLGLRVGGSFVFGLRLSTIRHSTLQLPACCSLSIDPLSLPATRFVPTEHVPDELHLASLSVGSPVAPSTPASGLLRFSTLLTTPRPDLVAAFACSVLQSVVDRSERHPGSSLDREK